MLPPLCLRAQVFYVVPRIEQVKAEVEQLQEALPDATISYAYSGLRDLEDRIVDFTMGATDVMVATTIMENGIDIPNVNTLIVQNTHLFGLSQLHQLRGRVGRSNLQAYALLFHPPSNLLSDIAVKRMRALEKAQDLGAGYQIAESDLKLRGARARPPRPPARPSSCAARRPPVLRRPHAARTTPDGA